MKTFWDETPATKEAENAYHAPYWAPNSNNLVAFAKPGEVGEVHMVESLLRMAAEQNYILATPRRPVSTV